MMPTIPHWLWLLWVLSGIAWGVWFGVIESIAIANGNSPDTLSQIIWGARVPAVIFFLGAGLIIFGTLWLLVHFASQGQ